MRRHERKCKKYRGNRSHGAGNIKNRRGKGSKGGVGRAGYHKHKWFHTIKYELNKISERHKGFTNPTKKKVREITLGEIAKQIMAGKFQKMPDGTFVVDLSKENAKILGNGEFSFKAQVRAKAFTAPAKEKIAAAGGSASTE
ncbi:MAG: uL15 family ribosomal protein [Candidatus Norongarragalinales archaeon]